MFELGRDDSSGGLQIPAQLYGREPEIAQHLETFGRIALDRAELLPVPPAELIGRRGR